MTKKATRRGHDIVQNVRNIHTMLYCVNEVGPVYMGIAIIRDNAQKNA